MPEQKRAAAKPFKDYLDPAAVQRLADWLGAAEGFDFPRQRFVELATEGLHELELKARVKHIAVALRSCLDPDFSASSRHIRNALPPPRTATDDLTDGGFFVWPLCQFVQDNGIGHFDEAMATMRHLTTLWSCEFAIRPFLVRYPDKTLAVLHRWAQDPNVHVRRLVSEGTRPLLPWGMRLLAFVDNPTPTLVLLERLKDDEALYVRRSVANHLNDIAKHHPERVVKVCARWMKGGSKQRQWIVRHALRTLVKRGDPGALQVLGVGPAKVEGAVLTCEPAQARIGDAVVLSAEVRSTAEQPQKLVIDCAVHFQKARGTSPKVFKWRVRELAAGETLLLDKKHSFADVSVRKHRPGLHRIELLVNGKALAETVVTLAI